MDVHVGWVTGDPRFLRVGWTRLRFAHDHELDPAGLNEIRKRFLTVERYLASSAIRTVPIIATSGSTRIVSRRLFGELLPQSLFAGDPARGPTRLRSGSGRCSRARSGKMGKPTKPDDVALLDLSATESEPERASFARAMADLLFGAGSSGARIERFNRSMWPVWKRLAGSGNPYAVTRSFPTFFLMLQSPEHDIYVRTDTFDRAPGSCWVGASWSTRFSTPRGMQVILDFAGAVRRHLVRWGWSPRDLIDVQSFLYVGTIPDEALAAAIADQAP